MLSSRWFGKLSKLLEYGRDCGRYGFVRRCWGKPVVMFGDARCGLASKVIDGGLCVVGAGLD
jgi:hypothetical protein